MCLILFAYRQHPEYPLVVAANRDEFYARPSVSAHCWDDAPSILAGRDLEAGGTWLGVDHAGRFAAVTNFAETPAASAPPLSRGKLTENFLRGSGPAADYAGAIEGADYRGFNLLLFDGAVLVYSSNRAATSILPPGVYGLANAELGARWPKVTRGSRALARTLNAPDTGPLITLLTDDTVPPDDELPDRGNDLDMERRVAPCFIRGDQYGTRASTAVVLREDRLRFEEQLYGPHGVAGDRAVFELATG